MVIDRKNNRITNFNEWGKMRKSWTFTQTSDLTGELGSHGKMDLDTTWQCHVCLKLETLV